MRIYHDVAIVTVGFPTVKSSFSCLEREFPLCIVDSGSTLGALDGNTNTGFGTEDMFLAKYDGSGNKLWIQQLGGEATDRGTDIAADAIGNIYIGGYTAEGIGDSAGAFLAKFAQ